MSRPLKAVLLDACSADVRLKSLAGLARALGSSRQSLYQRVERNRISPKYAERIVQACRGALAIEDLEPYIHRPGKK